MRRTRNPFWLTPKTTTYQAWEEGYLSGDDQNPYKELGVKNKFEDLWDEGRASKLKDVEVIPKGTYCYRENICPYWGSNKKKQNQSNGYCRFLRSGDWQENAGGLLWDQVKECGENPGDESDYFSEADYENFNGELISEEVNGVKILSLKTLGGIVDLKSFDELIVEGQSFYISDLKDSLNHNVSATPNVRFKMEEWIGLFSGSKTGKIKRLRI